MNLCTSVFVYIGSIVLYKRIVNADTQSIRIANTDGQGSGIDCFVMRVLPNLLPEVFFANIFKKHTKNTVEEGLLFKFLLKEHGKQNHQTPPSSAS